MSRSGCLMSFPLGTPICLILFVPKPACQSLRLGLGGFVCYSLLGGDIGRNPGPVLRPRGTLDCRFCILRSPWLEVSLCVSFDDAMSSVLSAAPALRGFRLHLYANGHPRYLLLYAVTMPCPSSARVLRRLGRSTRNGSKRGAW